MINRFFIALLPILFSLIIFSCKKDNVNEEKLRAESLSFFEQNNVDYQDLQSEYYVQKKQDNTHHILKYYKLIDNDSLFIKFSKDEKDKYWMEANQKFVQHYKK